ncbi:MAG: hypothetical protein ACUVV4_00905 [Candidatus Bathyarchaeia archaeon]
MKFVQLSSIRDLVMLIASSPSMNVIQHLSLPNFQLYFIIGGTLSETFLYFVKENIRFEGRFVTYNAYSGEINFSDKIKVEPNMSSFPIVEIKNQNILPSELLELLESS